MNKITNLVTVLMIAFTMFLIGMIGLNQSAEASPALAPTPVTGMVQSSDAFNVTFLGTTAVTADQDTSGRQIPEAEWCDIQYVADQTVDLDDSIVNTTTVTIQFSNDNSNWVAGPVLANANAVDGTDLTRFQIFGRYVGFDVNVTNSNPVTFTILGLCK